MLLNKVLQTKEKSKVKTNAESTKPGPIFTPAVDIFETDNEITVLADIPGVKSDGLDIDLRDNILSLGGTVESLETKEEQKVLTEFEIGKYWRQFTISNIIDQSKIDAELKDGVLRLTLPKAEKALPRKIQVKAA